MTKGIPNPSCRYLAYGAVLFGGGPFFINFPLFEMDLSLSGKPMVAIINRIP
jgi:hypothetical protein